ncbi:DUF2339 domain-containing protein [Haloarcula japonica]|uniref:DUF2339 domain-containing protein n=1 Tax=Haloarcula japonica (strain ATCC 49778 / DSM 6131 / JCM 7785 / NBRC 101032 / NCIMB 13157 / TR-1) TaxID=1227453 RepID=M0LBM0_HALJT|nr:DUF2339 domain-containing protein [Haloarcula japonica]EMA29834.1 hypothetical protein C444_13582 [Haloarcula japonica DSM 6131]
MSDEDDLRAEVRELHTEVDALHTRIAALESELDTDPPPSAEDQTASTAVESDTATPESESEDSSEPGTETGETADSEAPPEERNWERDIGMKWLGGVGGLALVVGVVFFIRLAIEAGYLGPLGRVLTGTVGGLILLAGGRYAAERQGYSRWGRLVAGTGLAIAYFSVYAAYGFESYRAAIGTPLWTVLLALTVLVAATAAVSVRDCAPAVAGEAFLLGYVTAYVGLDAGSFVVSPAYVVLLTAGLVTIAAVRPWSRLVLGSVLPAYVLHVAWMNRLEPPESVATAVLAATFAVYAAGVYVLRASGRTDRWHRRLVEATTASNAVFAAILLESVARRLLPTAPDGVAVGAVGLALGGVYAITESRLGQQNSAAGVLAVVLLAVGVVLAANPFAETVGLLILLCGALALGTQRDARAVRIGGHLVAFGTVAKLLAVDATRLPAFSLADPLATVMGRPAAYLLGIVVFYGLGRWFGGASTTVPSMDRELSVAAPYAWTATGLAVVLLGLELSGATLSVAWAVLGLAFVGVGLALDARSRRLQGVVVLALVTTKVFLYDTQGLDTLARTLSFLVLGGILLVASYAYARWQGEKPLQRLSG